MKNLTLIFRKANPLYFSIEKVFGLCIPFFEKEFHTSSVFAKASGVLPGSIIANLRQALLLKSELLHVTGDIHYIVAALPGNRTVLTIHDTVFMESAKGIKRQILQWLFLKYPVKHCRYITAISEATKRDIVRYTGCEPGKIRVIPDPVNPSFSYKPGVFNKQKPRILQIGTWPNKNLERLAASLKGISCTLTIIGKISAGQQFILQDNGIEYHSLQGISEGDLIAQYTLCDIVFFASTFEGFGLPLLEAQAIGRPVISSNISPMKEVAGEGACLVDPFDVLAIRAGVLRIIEQDQYRTEIIAKGLSNVKNYQPEIIAERYLALYQEIVSNNTSK